MYLMVYVMHEKCGTADAGNMMAIKAKGGVVGEIKRENGEGTVLAR